MKILVGVQARSASTRFPGKIYRELQGKPLLLWPYEAAKRAEEKLPGLITRVLSPKDDTKLRAFCLEKGISAYAPDCSENDLFARYRIAAKELECDAVIRITSDCWMANHGMILDCAKALLRGVDYISNTINRTFVEGLDVQAATVKAIGWMEGRQVDKEHPFFDFDKNLKVREKFEASGMKYEELVNPSMAGLLMGGSIDTEDDLKKWNKYLSEQGASFQ